MNKQEKLFLVKNQSKDTSALRFHILLAEDDYEMRALLSLALRRAGYNVTECSDGMGLLTHLEPFLLPNGRIKKEVDLIISDIRMPGVTGMEVLEGASENVDFPPMILITAFGDKVTHELATRFGAVAVLDKPFDMDALIAIVRELLPTQ